MSKASFISTERDIGEAWMAELQESMAEAGREERRLAEEREEYHEGVPSITVIVDGGWSKRSHKHSYNANSGVGIIIGKATGKLLYLGVRNKYCSACARNIPRDQHKCFKNWTRSSSEMETDIILEGFLEAERVHGVRYMKFVGDGDSSVYPTLLQNVPGWGHAIKKLECANHACKCYRGALERLIQDNPSYKGSGGLTKMMRAKLVSAARSAIRMRSKEKDMKKAITALKRDLKNGPQHCFGYHQNCSPDFCKTARKAIQQLSSSSSSSTTSSSCSSSTSSASSGLPYTQCLSAGPSISTGHLSTSTDPPPISTDPLPASTGHLSTSTDPPPISTNPLPASTGHLPTSTNPLPASTGHLPTSTDPPPISTDPLLPPSNDSYENTTHDLIGMCRLYSQKLFKVCFI